MQKTFDSVRTQYRACFKRMAFEGMRWNLHRVPGTDRFAIFREDVVFDVPLPLVVRDIQCMTEERLLSAVQTIIRG